MSEAQKDFYKILGVSKSATPAEIKKSYRKLAVKYHPDKNQGDDTAAEKFKEIAAAYDILSDPQKKEEYDNPSHRSPPGPGPAQQGGFRSPFGPDIFGSDLFEHFFGRGSHAHARAQNVAANSRGANIVVNLHISFPEAVKGTTKNIRIERNTQCESCDGLGGSGSVACAPCDGSGVLTMQNGGMVYRTTCQQCAGSGSSLRDKCSVCNGSGTGRQESKVSVKIPAGVSMENQLRLSSMGHYGKGGWGDLFVNVNIPEDPRFKRVGKDIHSSVQLSVAQAALGCTLKIPTVYGEKNVNIPGGAQPGSVLKMSGLGMADLGNGPKGNHKLRIEINIPTHLSEKQRHLFEKLLTIEGGDSP